MLEIILVNCVIALWAEGKQIEIMKPAAQPNPTATLVDFETFI